MSDANRYLVFFGGIVVCAFLLLFCLQGVVSRPAFSLFVTILLAAGSVYFFLVAREATATRAKRRRARILLPLLGTVVAVLLVFVPELGRMTGGWKANRGWTPPVVSPGDSARLAFPHTVQTVAGNWAGRAHVDRATVAGGGEIEGFTASGPKQDWGDSVKGKSSKTEVWAEVTAPQSPALVGATVHLELSLDVTFVEGTSYTEFEERTEHFEHKATLVLSSPGAGGRYGFLWWSGTLVGLLLFFVSAGLALKES